MHLIIAGEDGEAHGRHYSAEAASARDQQAEERTGMLSVIDIAAWIQFTHR